MRSLPVISLLLLSACGPSDSDASPTTRTIHLSGWTRDADGNPLSGGRAVLTAFWMDWGNKEFRAKVVADATDVDETGAFSFFVDGVPQEQNVCCFWLAFEPIQPPRAFVEDRPSAFWLVKWPIPEVLNWGAVRLHRPSDARPFASLSDDELASRIGDSWSSGESGPGSFEWDWLLDESVRRGGERWERALQSRLDALFETDDWRRANGADLPELELLTALRRIQGRPDPIQLEVVRGSDLVVESPAMPEVVVRIRNRDSLPVSVTEDWFKHWLWRAEARRTDGSPIPPILYSMWGTSRVEQHRFLQPGQSLWTKLKLEEQIAPFTGTAELELTYSDRQYLRHVMELDGLILFHPESVAIEVRSPAHHAPSPAGSRADLWPVAGDDDRLRTLAQEANVPLLEREGVLLVATGDCGRFVDVLENHDVLLLRADAWWREEVGARRETKDDIEFAKPEWGSDPDDGARSILAARFWLQDHGPQGARYVFHFREHGGR